MSDQIPRPGDLGRMKVAGVEVEERIVEVADSVLHVRVVRGCSDLGFEETLKALLQTPPPRDIPKG